MKLHTPVCLFDLAEENERRLPKVRSLRLIKEDRYGGWLKIYCFICKEVLFEQYTVIKGKPV